MLLKKVSLIMVCAMCLILSLPDTASAKQSEETIQEQIPIVMEPGTVITYDVNNNPIISMYPEPTELNGLDKSLNSIHYLMR